MIARCAEAAERHGARCSGGGPVAIDDAGAGAFDIAIPQRVTLADQPPAQALGGRIGGANGIVESRDPAKLQYRREDLLVRRIDAGNIDNPG